MPKFRSRPVVIDAEQWFPEKTGQMPWVITSRGKEPYVFTAADRPVPVKPGYWVVPESCGWGHVAYSPEAFAALYDAVSDEE